MATMEMDCASTVFRQKRPSSGNLRELESFVKRYLVMGHEELILGESRWNNGNDGNGLREHRFPAETPELGKSSRTGKFRETLSRYGTRRTHIGRITLEQWQRWKWIARAPFSGRNARAHAYFRARDPRRSHIRFAFSRPDR